MRPIINYVKATKARDMHHLYQTHAVLIHTTCGNMHRYIHIIDVIDLLNAF